MVGTKTRSNDATVSPAKEMTRRIIITPRANQDIDELFAFIAQDNTVEVSKRVLMLSIGC